MDNVRLFLNYFSIGIMISPTVIPVYVGKCLLLKLL